jgi:hypothetical protein
MNIYEHNIPTKLDALEFSQTSPPVNEAPLPLPLESLVHRLSQTGTGLDWDWIWFSNAG